MSRLAGYGCVGLVALALLGCGASPNKAGRSEPDDEALDASAEEMPSSSPPRPEPRTPDAAAPPGVTPDAAPPSVQVDARVEEPRPDARPAADATAVDRPRPSGDGGAGPSGAKLGPVLFTDKIAAGDVSAFKPVHGTWALCPYKDRMAYCQSNPTGMAWAVAGDPAWTDYEVEATLVIDRPEPEKGLALVGFRVATPEKLWMFSVQSRMSEQINIAWEHGQCDAKGCGHSNGSPYGHMPGEPFPLRFRVQGGSAVLYGQEWSATKMAYNYKEWPMSHSYPAAGQVAVGSMNATVKVLSLKVTQLLP